MTPFEKEIRRARRVVVALAVTPLALFVLLAALAAAGAPIPGFSKVQAPLVKVNTSTVGIRASSSAQSGYMSATQSSDLAFLLSGGGSVADPLTVPHWSSSTGFDNITTTALVDSNMEFMGLGALAVGQLQGIGGEVALASDTGTRANTTDITGSLTQTGGLTWALPGGIGNGIGVSSNKFYDATGAGAGDVVVSGADGFTQATLATGVGANNTGILFRWSNAAASGFNLLYFSDGNYYVNRYTAGVPLTVSSGACHSAPFPGLVLRADYLGSAVTISCNGVTVGSFTDSNYLANTRAGLAFIDGANTERFTNFSTGTGTARSLLASPLNATTIFEESFQTFKVDHDETIAGQLTSAGDIESTGGDVLSDTGNVIGQQLQSTIPSGGAPPLVVASNTRVDLLNADLLDGIDSAAFYQSGDSPSFNVLTANTVTATVQLGLADHPRGVCSAPRAGDINYDSGHFYGCNGSTWLQLDN